MNHGPSVIAFAQCGLSRTLQCHLKPSPGMWRPQSTRGLTQADVYLGLYQIWTPTDQPVPILRQPAGLPDDQSTVRLVRASPEVQVQSTLQLEPGLRSNFKALPDFIDTGSLVMDLNLTTRLRTLYRVAFLPSGKYAIKSSGIPFRVLPIDTREFVGLQQRLRLELQYHKNWK